MSKKCKITVNSSKLSQNCMLFTLLYMKRILFYSIEKIFICLVIVLLSSCSSVEHKDFSKRTKIALRDVGNQLLLSNQDSTSLILPVLELNSNTFQISFSNPLAFEPSTLVSIIQKGFKSAQLPEQYRVEVLQCNDLEVAYSYQIADNKERTIIPCSGRHLPNACYLIEIQFTNRPLSIENHQLISFTIIFLGLLGIGYLFFKKTKDIKLKSENGVSEKIGSFYFYPEQNKLVKEAKEIALSKKECELLALFVAHPNQIIKRDELTKRVWEDNGVFVGRSLDTYISKLRKKLKSDTSVKLTNVHGVGYKLEID